MDWIGPSMVMAGFYRHSSPQLPVDLKYALFEMLEMTVGSVTKMAR